MVLHDEQYEAYIQILKEELIPAFGCTELIAYVQADSDIPAVVTISGEMLKTLAVTVPANN